MSQGGRIDQQSIDFFGAGFMNFIDKNRLAIRLQAADINRQFFGNFFQAVIYVAKSSRTIDGLLSGAEKIEIWPVQYENFQFKP